MKGKVLSVLLGIFLLVVVSPQVSAVCTATLDKNSYTPGESPQVTGSCSSNNERNRAYTFLWINSSGVNFANNTGTTPGTTDTAFLGSVTVPLSSPTPSGLNISLQGSNLEGFDNATVLAASSSSLLIAGIRHRGTFLGLSSSLDIDVTDENDKKITGGMCGIAVKDPSNDENLIEIEDITMADGDADFTWILNYERFREAKDYNLKVECFCGSNVTALGCFDEDGLSVSNSVGSAEVPFTTSSWIVFNSDPMLLVDTEGSQISNVNLTAGYDRINYLRNTSNNNPLGEAIEADIETFLINNLTGKGFGGAKIPSRGFLPGNSTSIFDHPISLDTETGSYYILSKINLIYKGQFTVAQYIINTEVFNVTSLNDTFVVNEVEVHDFFGNELNLSETRQNSGVIPLSNFSDPFTLATENFKSQFCINGTNSRDDEIELWAHNIIFENPNTSLTRIISDEFVLISELEAETTSEVCIDVFMPPDLVTNSDYRFLYELHIGTDTEPFLCDVGCDFEGHTDFFYVASIEDMIDIPKFIRSPTATDLGRPGIFVVNNKGEKSYMFNDYNYTNQVVTDWFNNSATCFDKDGTSPRLCNLSSFPVAGEDITVCFEARSYFRDEVFLILEDFTMDKDSDESTIQLPQQPLDVAIKSVTDSDMYLSQTPSRAFEGDRDLTDGRSFLCTSPMTLPHNMNGGNDWDVQLRARMDNRIYNLPTPLNWIIESDEFPVFGKITSEPTWDLHLFEPIHYRIPEVWKKVASNRWEFNFSIRAFPNAVASFNIGEHFPLRLLGGDSPFEKIVNFTATYSNGTAVDYTTEVSSQQDQIVLMLKAINFSRTDNNFTLTAYTLNLDERQTIALESIENKTGIFHLDVNCPVSARLGTSMECTITAFIEDVTVPGVEVQFVCSIDNEFSKTTFAHRITQARSEIPRNFFIPTEFSEGSEHTLTCSANRFGLGSRGDPFSDSFIVRRNSAGIQGFFDDLIFSILAFTDGREAVTAGVIGSALVIGLLYRQANQIKKRASKKTKKEESR